MEPETRVIGVERVDDIPVLFASLQRLRIAQLLDSHFHAHEHHRWKGELTFGEVVCVWLVFVASEGDHRLYKLQGWVADHLLILQACLAKTIRPLDFHDDRLADVLDTLPQAGLWQAFEADLNRHTVRVYRLSPSLFRHDSTTASSYAQVLSESGLIQFGHSKDHDDLPQLKVAIAALDPLGMPVTTVVVPGNRADDPLYVPEIKEVQQSFGAGGLTHVGDCKMGSLPTRAYVAGSGDYYLCPLSGTQVSRAEMLQRLQPVWHGQQPLQQVYRPRADAKQRPATAHPEPGHQPDPDAGATNESAPARNSNAQEQDQEWVAEGFVVAVPLQATVGKDSVRWTERRWVVRSVAFARSQQEQLEKRLRLAAEQLEQLHQRKRGKKRLRAEEMQQAAQDIVKEHRVEGLLAWEVRTTAQRRTLRKYRDRPRQVVQEKEHRVERTRQEEAIEQAKRESGWRVYGTNHQEMNLAGVVWGYRGQYHIENDWSRLKGKPLSLTPMYLTSEQRMMGLVLLLSVVLRLLTLLEWVVRKKLDDSGEKLTGVYPGQPGRQTNRTSVEMLLRVFEGISLMVIEVAGRVQAFITPLTALQEQLLRLWDLPSDLYQRLASLLFPNPPPFVGER
jgi:transposase